MIEGLENLKLDDSVISQECPQVLSPDSPVVRLHSFTIKGPVSIPGAEAKILQAKWCDTHTKKSILRWKWSESHSVVSDCFWPRG